MKLRRFNKLTILLWGTSITLCCALVLTAYLYATAPVEQLRGHITYTPPYQKPGQSLSREAGLGLKDNLQISDMPVSMVLSTLVAEDFYYPLHNGFRPEVIWLLIRYSIEQDIPLPGGSTITQQVAKNLFTDARRTFWRKYVEAVYTAKLEQLFTKDEIFTLYINLVQTGDGLYGYKAAAEHYFHKPVNRLSRMEAIAISSSLTSPVRHMKWLEDGTADKDVYRRLLWNTRRTLRQESVFQYDADIPPGKFFTVYLTPKKPFCNPSRISDFSRAPRKYEPNELPGMLKIKPYCMSDDEVGALLIEADTQIRAFLATYYKGDLADLGVPPQAAR